MSKKQSRRNNSRRAGWRKSRVAASIILALVCVISTTMLAQVISRKAQPAHSGEVSTASLTPGSPSKEMIYAGGRLIATEEPAGPICTYSIFPQSQGFTSSGGTGSVSVTAGAGCGWTAGSNASFLTITSGSSGSGNGTVNYSVASNCGAFRSGTLTIAGLTFTVNQDATIPPLYEGWHDSADCNAIVGWAADRNRLNTSISVDIYDGTAYLTTVLANQYRPDIAAYLGDNGLHGFSFATPASLKNGQPHSVFVKFSGTSTNLSGTPKSITCVVLPNAPSSLAATAASTSQINLTWADNSTNETGFKLERKTGAGGVYSQIATPLANATSHPDTGLAASTTYFYRIRATNSAGDSAYSNEASATTSTAGGTGTGLKGEYFTNRTLTGPPAVTRVDPTINLAWGTGSPDPAIPIDQFSVLWTGQVQAQFSQTYTFYVFSDDGIKMWVNGQLLIDRWFDQYGPEVASAPIALIAGQKYDIRIEYYEAFGGAELHLSWSSASTAKVIVLHSQLYPPAVTGNFSLSLNGSSAYMSVPSSSSLNVTGPFTVEAWIQTNTPTATLQGIAEKYRWLPGTGNGGFAFRLGDGRLQLYTIVDSNQYDLVVGNSIIPIGWHHVAGVWDGNEMRLYLDGVLNGFKSSTLAPAAGSSTLMVGQVGTAGYPFNGLIDEARITGSALYTGQSFTVERQLTAVAGTRALWKFDGQSTSDSSGNGNTGTLVSGAGFSADVPTSACVSPVASAPALQSDTVWVEDAPPAGAIIDGNWGAASWRWDTRQKASGTQSHTDPLTGGMHQHFFYNAPLTTSPGDKFVCYVLVNPCNPPREVMLQWLGPEGTWEHRAFWGENLLGWGTTGTGSRLGMGALPQAGAWVRLEVPTSSVGLSGATINGVAFTLYDGQACFDRVGKATGPPPPATNNASFVSQTPPPLQMTPSQTASVSVTMQNTGTTTWTAADGYKLGSQNPQDNLTWGLGRVVVPNSVAPGAQVTFNFAVTAPATTGTYNFQWQMLREGVEWFGSPTTNMAITVSSGGGGGGSCSQVTVFSGSGIGGYLEGLGTAARWYFPYDGVVGKDPVSGLNALFVADAFNHRIRMVYLEGANAGLSILIAGSGTAGYWEGDGDPYQARYNLPTGLAVIKDAGGIVTTLLVVDGGNNMIRKLDRPLSGSAWRPSWLSGQTGAGYADGPPDQTQFFFPRKAVVALDGFIYVTDSMNNRIRKLNLAGDSSTLAAGINTPVGITVSRTTGVLYLTENGAPSVWSLTTAGTANRIAGNGTAGVWDGTGAAARFSAPDQLDWTNAGGSEALYIGDRLNHKIRKLAVATTVVTTFAGSGTAGYVNGSCSAAQFNNPRGVPIGPLGEIYVIDAGNYRIRKVQ